MEKIEKILFWCFVLGFAVMFIWMGMILFAGESIYSFHFDEDAWLNGMISKELFFTANLIGIGMWKMGVILFFCIPWLAMKIAGR